MKRLKVPASALKIIKRLQKNGYQAYLVGGCIRDALLGLKPKEWDITTSAKPQEVVKLFKKTIPTGIKYGTVTIFINGDQYEVTTFRSDQNYLDGRHPDNVVFASNIHEDLCRRDFTINALAYNPTKKELIDDFNGQKDLKKKIIKAIGRPIERLSEDGLRSIRACRFAAKLNFKIEPSTLAAIKKTLKITKKVAWERIHDELVKIMATKQPSIALDLMRKTGLLKIILPELQKCYGVKQPRQFHQYDVYWHSLKACDAAPAEQPLLRLAALLHDIAKPEVKKGQTFYNHEKRGAKKVVKILKRLKFSRSDIRYVVNLVENHMFNYTPEWTDAAVRRFLRRIGGTQNIKPLFDLRKADTQAMAHTNGLKYLTRLQAKVNKIKKQADALQPADLKISGHDVMKILKIEPGPKVGKILHKLLEEVLEDPKLNQKRKLKELIKKYA